MDNRRRSLVVNKQFQYQHSLLVVALAVLLVNIALIVNTLLPSERPLIMTNAMALGLGTLEFLLIAGVWYGSLRATHRIAGPVLVFAREVAKLGRGDLTAQISLREGDMFQDTADEMNASFVALRTRAARLKNIARQLGEAKGDQRVTQALVAELQEELARLDTDAVAVPAVRQALHKQEQEQEHAHCLAH
jgi:methyl-accepting chemotaxis protein